MSEHHHPNGTRFWCCPGVLDEILGDSIDTKPLDRTPNTCWRCNYRYVPVADVIGLCAPCLKDLGR